MHRIRHASRRTSRLRGFTLIELLVAIAIVAVVVSLVIVAARGVRGAAGRADALNALRNLGAAHAAYSADHRQRFMPGYVDASLQASLGIGAELPDGTPLVADAAAPYLFRLAPYLSWNWKTAFREQLVASEDTRLETLFETGDLVALAERPRFGLNAVFVGGHSDGAVPAYSPWNSAGNQTVAATRLTEVRNPATLILFGSVRLADGSGVAQTEGFHELRAPFLDVAQWTAGNQGAVPAGSLAGPAGLPGVRDEPRLATFVNVDGNTEAIDVSDVSVDMRRWSPVANSADWRVGQ